MKPSMDVSCPHILVKIYETFVDLSPHFEEFLITIRQGLATGFTPKLTSDGTSGTYLLYNQSGQNIV